jgi:HK97 family phage portal protein
VDYLAGVANQLDMRRPETVTVDLVGDEPRYTVNDPRQIVFADRMLHVPGLGGDGISGWSVVQYAAQSIGSGVAADKYAGGQWGNGATPAGVLTHPMRLDKAAREHLRREWEEVHRGSDNANKVAIMHGGMEFKPISMPNKDAQFLESRQFSIREIARWFRLPPHMLADLQDSSVRANIEQQAIEFIVYSLKPWLTRWQQTLNRKLLGEDERESLYFEFLLESLLQGDSAAQAAAFSVGRQWGWYSVNEIRRMLNMPPVDGGDVYLQPSNMVPADSEMASGDKPDPPPQMLPPPADEEEPEEDDEEQPEDDEETPEALARELRTNHTASIAAIVDAAKSMRAFLEQDGQVGVAYTRAETELRGLLGDLRGVRQEIHRDLTEQRLSQIQGCDQHLVEAAHALLHEHLRVALKTERNEILKAARCVVRGRNFIEWLDGHYRAYVPVLAERIRPAVEAFQTIRMTLFEPHVVHAEAYCLRHKAALIKASDGNRKDFLARVQTVLDGWDDEVATIRLGD